MSEVRILVTGSRTWNDEYRIQECLLAWEIIANGAKLVLVHGAAEGADTMAADFAKSRGWTIEPYPVTPEDWQKYGKKAGFLRNKKMVETKPDVCLAFIHNASRGATMTAGLADMAGILVFRYVDKVTLVR